MRAWTLEARCCNFTTGLTTTGSYTYTYTVYHHAAWYGMAALVVFLLITCALLAGLTLAICGLDMTWLQVRCVTGSVKQRQQALVVARMKHYESWMLCSLIICSVACGESLPIIMQRLWHGPQQWVSIVVSTLLIAAFAEILPQYFIRRNAISWGYYCWPIIWSCMWSTVIISYPISWILDTTSGYRHARIGILTSSELAAMVKYHELTEMHGGFLGQDATRIMLGALHLDSRRVGGDTTVMPDDCLNANEKDVEKDVEKANFDFVRSMVVRWSSVKTVNINDPVDEAFFKKIKSWSYSRIPVVSTDSVGNDGKTVGYSDSAWRGKIFGFLHTKVRGVRVNLLGLDINSNRNPETGIFVKDLPLYPLPIIRDDMPVYDLLNMFQLGMSRMAVVISAPYKDFWTAANESSLRQHMPMNLLDGYVDWTTDFLEAARSGKITKSPLRGPVRVVGIRCPMPIGIITYETILDSLFQKTCKDEKDFFGPSFPTCSAWSRKESDLTSRLNAQVISNRSPTIPAYMQKVHSTFQRSTYGGTLRRRNFSRSNHTVASGDDTSDRGICTFDGINEHCSNVCGNRLNGIGSPYIWDSDGDSYGTGLFSIKNCGILNPEDDINLAPRPARRSLESEQTSLAAKTASLPSRTNKSSLTPGSSALCRRHFSAGDAPRLPRLLLDTPFSSQKCSGYEGISWDERHNSDLEFPFLYSVMSDMQINSSASDVTSTTRLDIIQDHSLEDGGDTASLASCGYGHRCDGQEDQCNQAKQCSASPEISTTETPTTLHDEETCVPTYAAKTLFVRRRRIGDVRISSDSCLGETPIREKSFDDDRYFLPSQRKIMDEIEFMGDAQSLRLPTY